MDSRLRCIELIEIQSKKNSYLQVLNMLTANLSGYPKRPDLESIRKYLDVGGENPFITSVKNAVQGQIKAKIDIVTDGQIRSHPIDGFQCSRNDD